MVVKQTIILIFVLLLVGGCVSISKSQKKIQGTFYEKYSPIGIGSSYQFKDGTFISTNTYHLGKKQRFGGSYFVIVDTLILDYEFIADPDPTIYKITRREPVKGDTIGSVQFRALNKQGERGLTPQLVPRAESEFRIKSYVPDTLGYYPVVKFYDDRIVDFVIEDPLRSKPVVIPMDTLAGYHSEITVTFSDSTVQYSDYEGIKKYLIKEAKKDRIVLQPLDANDDRKRIVLVRTGTE